MPPFMYNDERPLLRFPKRLIFHENEIQDTSAHPDTADMDRNTTTRGGGVVRPFSPLFFDELVSVIHQTLASKFFSLETLSDFFSVTGHQRLKNNEKKMLFLLRRIMMFTTLEKQT